MINSLKNAHYLCFTERRRRFVIRVVEEEESNDFLAKAIIVWRKDREWASFEHQSTKRRRKELDVVCSSLSVMKCAEWRSLLHCRCCWVCGGGDGSRNQEFGKKDQYLCWRVPYMLKACVDMFVYIL